MPDQPDQPAQSQFPDAPPLFEPEPKRPRAERPKSTAERALPWILGAMVVLMLAASAGLLTAWLVATMHAVPGPVAVAPTATPGPTDSAVPSSEPGATPTDQLRHTPEPSSLPTQEPAPFTYVVQRGDSVTGIAQTFQVNWEDIVGLNDLQPPRYRIFPGEELQIPGYAVQPTPKPGH